MHAEPTAARSRVIVFGGTGRTGRLIVADALAEGHDVTVAARRPQALSGESALPAGAAVVRADVHDPASVMEACRGQDAVIIAVSTPARKPGTLYSDAARSVVAAASATGPRRAIVISSGGVRTHDPALPFWYRQVLIPLFMKDLYADMGAMESVVTASRLQWTIVRASYLQDGPSRGYRVAEAATPARGWKLSRADLARFTVDQLRDDHWIRKYPTLAE